MPSYPLIALLCTPENVAQVAESEWNELIETGRKTQLLGQLAAVLHSHQLMQQVPVAVQRHLALARLTVMRRNQSALWEIDNLRRAISPSIPLVLLKGCAYLAKGDQNAAGRLFSDIDVLVRHRNLPGVEADLMAVGWKPSRVNAYDQAYYRNWMHEVPPMVHVRRHTVVDLHHAINPPVSRFYIDPERFFDRLDEPRPGIFVLCTDDRVVHCALHVLQEGDPTKVIRDLYDLHSLLQQHHGSPQALDGLRQRSQALGVLHQVNAAIGAANTLFSVERDKPVPSGWLQASLVKVASLAFGGTSLVGEGATLALLAYAHWIKMPVHILLPHLVHKSRTWLMLDRQPRMDAA